MSDPGMTDPSASDSQQHAASQAMTLPGAKLAACREERGWTIQQVASQLNLAPRQIVALESDDYPSLPGMPIVRGFIRAYAKLLKIDPAPLLASLGGENILATDTISPRKTLSSFSEARMPSMVERSGFSSKWVVGVLVAALVAVGLWALQSHDQSAAPGINTSQEVKDTGVRGAGAGTNLPKQGTTSLGDSGDIAVPTPPAVGNATPTDIQNEAPAPSTPAATSQNTPAAEAATTGKDALVLTVREDSWIEIRRESTGRVLLSRIVKAGENETFEVNEPISMIVGNANGVDATLRGEPLELKTSSKSNVSRLNLK